MSSPQVADLRSELELLGLDSKGPKPLVTQRLLDFFTARDLIDLALRDDGKARRRAAAVVSPRAAPQRGCLCVCDYAIAL